MFNETNKNVQSISPKIDNYIESSKMCQKIIQWCAKIRNAPQCIENISTDVDTFPNVYYF